MFQIDPEGNTSYAILPKNNEGPKQDKGYQYFDFDNQLVIAQAGQLHQIYLEDMNIYTTNIEEWKSSKYMNRTYIFGNDLIFSKNKGLFSTTYRIIRLKTPN